MRSYFDGLMRYFEFSGRSTRMQYWMFFVVQVFVFIAAVVIDIAVFGASAKTPLMMPATVFVAIFHVIPSLTVQVRRLHDIGKSGAWWLLNFVPFGGLVLLYWACCASEDGRNYYDSPEPSSYTPRPSAKSQYSTIPRGVRMGSGSGSSSATAGRPQPSEGRFI